MRERASRETISPYYLDKLKEVREHTLTELAKRDDAWLMQVDPDRVRGEPTNNYCKWFHVCEHESNHNGQIKWIKGRLPSVSEARARSADPTYGVGLVVVALAVVGPRVRSTRSRRMFSALVALGIDRRLFRSVIGTGPLRIRIGSGFRRNLLLARRHFPGNMMSCRFGLSTVSSVTR